MLDSNKLFRMVIIAAIRRFKGPQLAYFNSSVSARMPMQACYKAQPPHTLANLCLSACLLVAGRACMHVCEQWFCEEEDRPGLAGDTTALALTHAHGQGKQFIPDRKMHDRSINGALTSSPRANPQRASARNPRRTYTDQAQVLGRDKEGQNDR